MNVMLVFGRDEGEDKSARKKLGTLAMVRGVWASRPEFPASCRTEDISTSRPRTLINSESFTFSSVPIYLCR